MVAFLVGEPHLVGHALIESLVVPGLERHVLELHKDDESLLLSSICGLPRSVEERSATCPALRIGGTRGLGTGLKLCEVGTLIGLSALDAGVGGAVFAAHIVEVLVATQFGTHLCAVGESDDSPLPGADGIGPKHR